MKIEHKEVTEEDIGSKVTYVPRHANKDASHKDAERGFIHRLGSQEHGIFVKYTTGAVALTPTELLVWG